MTRVLLMALAGLALGGAFSTYRQGRSRSVWMVLLVVGVLLVWAAFSVAP